MRPALAFSFAAAFIAACETQPLDSSAVNTPDGGATTTVSSGPPSCLGTMASFEDGLREDIAASVGPELRTPSNDMVFGAVSLLAGYGVDLVTLTTGFSVGRSGIVTPSPTEPTLSFGGWRNNSSGRNPGSRQAAEQLWTALASATETVDSHGIFRTTLGRRAACRRDDSSTICELTGLLLVDAAEVPCQ